MRKYRRKGTVDAFRLGLDEPPEWFEAAISNGEACRTGGDVILSRTSGKPILMW